MKLKEIEKLINKEHKSCEAKTFLCSNKAVRYYWIGRQRKKNIAVCLACWGVLSRQGIKLTQLPKS